MRQTSTIAFIANIMCFTSELLRLSYVNMRQTGAPARCAAASRISLSHSAGHLSIEPRLAIVPYTFGLQTGYPYGLSGHHSAVFPAYSRYSPH